MMCLLNFLQQPQRIGDPILGIIIPAIILIISFIVTWALFKHFDK